MSMYVLHVQTMRELKVKRELLRKGITAYVPQETALLRKGGKWHEFIRMLMFGYVFIRLDSLTPERYYSVKQTPGVIRFLGSPPEPLPKAEEQRCIWLLNDGEPLKPSKGYVQNGRLVPTEGFLSEFPGTIKSFNRRQKRATAILQILGREHEVTLSVDFTLPPS